MCSVVVRRPSRSALFPYTTLFRSILVYPSLIAAEHRTEFTADVLRSDVGPLDEMLGGGLQRGTSTLLIGPSGVDRKSTRLNSSHVKISYAGFCLKKKTKRQTHRIN